jgi:hypothetical protein
MIVNVGIIVKELPKKNKYVNLNNIKTLIFEEISKSLLKEFLILIQLNYLRNKENKYYPEENNVVPYFQGHNSKCFWSFYFQHETLIDNKNQNTIVQNKLIGVMTSRPLHVVMNINNQNCEFDVYYVDYLCVNKDWRNKNIAPQIIQTHEYIQSHSNKKISVSLFKKEDQLTGIIPLTFYNSYCFDMFKWKNPNPLLKSMSILNGSKQNIYYLYNFINENRNKMIITIIPEMTNLIELINTNNLFVKMIVTGTKINACYIFKKTCTFLDKNQEIISCIASINGTLSEGEFIRGFKNSLLSIVDENKNFSHCVIEDISDNHFIVKNIMIITKPLIISPTAYFFYNFAYQTLPSSKVFIIN